MRWLTRLCLLMLAPSAWAQSSVQPLENDPRFEVIKFKAGEVFAVATSLETTQIILFDEGERILSVILSDPITYSVNLSGNGASLTLRPNGRSEPVTMTVRTSARSYELKLAMSASTSVPEIVRFSYPGANPVQQTQAASVPAQANATWRFSGNRVLRPASISDDGKKTYIAWPDDQAMPAVFAIGLGGKEEMVDGYVRSGMFTIDRVYDQLVFRIDRRVAKVRRVVKRR